MQAPHNKINQKESFPFTKKNTASLLLIISLLCSAFFAAGISYAQSGIGNQNYPTAYNSGGPSGAYDYIVFTFTNNTGTYYAAKDSFGRIIDAWTTTNFTALYNNIVAASPDSPFQDSGWATDGMFIGKTVSIYIKNGFYTYDTTLSIPTSSNVKIIGEQNSAWQVQRITNSTIYYGGVTLYYTGETGQAISLLPRGIYPSTQLHLENMEIRVHDPGVINSSAIAVNLAGMYSGIVKNINIVSDNLPNGTNNIFHIGIGLNLEISAKSDNKIVNNVKVFGFHTKGVLINTPHINVQSVVSGLVLGYANARAFEIHPQDEVSYKNLHAYYSVYGLTSSASTQYPLIIDNMHFETCTTPYLRTGGSNLLILNNPVFNYLSYFTGDVADPSRCRITNAIFTDDGTTLWTNTNTTTLTNVADGDVIPIGLGGIKTVPAWVTVQSQNSTAIIASVTAWNATTATVSLKDITGAGVTGQTITLSYGRYPDS